MKHIKKFDKQTNEGVNGEYSPEQQPKVKDIIKYLSSLDPEMEVYLDKDGWDMSAGDTSEEIVKNSGLFWPWTNTEGTTILTINN